MLSARAVMTADFPTRLSEHARRYGLTLQNAGVSEWRKQQNGVAAI